MTSPLAVILGAGPLLGLSVTRRFAREGFRTALVGRDAGFVQAESGTIPGAHGFVADLGEPGAVPEVFRRIRADLGEADVLVCHASSGGRGPASGLEPDLLLHDLWIDALAPLEAVREVLPAMRRNRRGTILFTGGGLALKPQADLASASVGKAAVRQLALCLAEELRPDGIHVATVTIAGFVQRDSPFSPERIAEHYWELHDELPERWRSEVVLRPPAGDGPV